jgi:choline dehydrogenase-like flavoprotein
MDLFDYVVVGGGSAGSVIASRLSEQPDARVLLLEAGPADGPPMMSVPGAWPLLVGSEVDWRFTTTPQTGLEGRPVLYPRGRVLGGSSAINAMVFLRGHRAAIDAWESAAATGWGFDDLLPYYRRAEQTRGLDAAYHGTEGPMRPTVSPTVNAVTRAAFEAFQESGYPVSADLNAAQAEGVAFTPLTVVDGVRQSAADAYLRPVLDRPNLTVRTDAVVHALTFSGTRCTGVRYVHDGTTHTVEAAREVVLCAGAVSSPHLLMLSGVGPADALRAHGIDVVADLPAVGANLSDHPLGAVVYSAGPDRWESLNTHNDVIAALRSDPALAAPDLHIFLLDIIVPVPGVQLPEAGYTMAFAALSPHSRGSVTLVSNDPGTPPAIDPAFLSDERDVQVMLAGLAMAREIGAAKALAPWRGDEVLPGSAMSTTEQLRFYLKASVQTYFHPVGTCRLGTGPSAVTDLRLRVRGVENLRVVDASVLPSLPGANPNATILAVAERGAALIAEDHA